MNMRGVTPAVIATALPTFDWIEPAKLFVEQDYQRALGENSIAMIRRIVAKWNWAHIKPAICVREGKQLFVIDGQHTAIAAASHGGVAKIPVMIVDAKTIGDRAKAFISQNRDRLALTPMHMHFAALAAGDEVAIAVDQACRKAGVTILKFGRGPAGVYRTGETFAVGIITRIVRTSGVNAGARVLKVLIEAKRAPLAAHEIGAVAILLLDAQYKSRVDAFDLATAIRSRTIDEWKATAATLKSKGTPARIALATALLRSLLKEARDA
jgi:hypothetical protein